MSLNIGILLLPLFVKHFLALIVVFLSIDASRQCRIKTRSGELIWMCCADSEAEGKHCIACSKGYTSTIGQNCKPCTGNTYGDRCKFDCHCLYFEICDHVNGCVKFPSTRGTSVDATSHNRTYTSTVRTATYSVNDITIAYREENTNKPSTDCINKGLLFREVIVYSALSVLVIGFGICLCFVLFKYKTLSKKHLVTISQTRNALITLQIQPHETADRLYDIINDEDILDDRRIQQMLMSSNYLDVIHDSNTRESCESNRCPNQDNPCQLLSIDQTQNQENNLKVDGHSLMSGDNTSSSDEYQWDSTQDYLNPYQPMIEISPPVENKYLTIATAHNRHDRGDGNYKDSTVVRNAYEPQHPRKMEKDAMANLHDNYKSSSISIGSNISKGVSNREGGKESKSYLNHTKI